MSAAQTMPPRQNFNLSPERKAFLVEHAGREGWTIERMAHDLSVPMSVVHGWLERDDMNRAIIKRRFEDTQRAIQGASAPTVEEKTPPLESEPEPAEPQHCKSCGAKTHGYGPLCIECADTEHAIEQAEAETNGFIMAHDEPVTPPLPDTPRRPLSVLIEDLDEDLLMHLMSRLPTAGVWTLRQRDRWLAAFTACLDLCINILGSGASARIGGMR